MKLTKNRILFILFFLILFFILIFYFIGQEKKSNKSNFTNIIPYNLGIHTHMSESKVDVIGLKNNGFKIVRDDITWSRVEYKPNQYDFENSGYDDYNKELVKSGIRPYYVLGFSNKLYEENNSVITNKGREAYTKFVAKTASRYKNQNIIWEIWNEPNTERFWNPTFTSVEKYTDLVQSAAHAIRKNDPSGVIVAPALAEINQTSLYWLEETFKRGLLNNIDAISIHPYRGTPPETVISDYKLVKSLIAKYTKKDISILSGEWGYSTGLAFYGIQLDQRQQCQYLVRMFLVNLYQEIPVSIWYDWKNDGQNKDDGEQNFGIREFDSSVPKESALGASTLFKMLSGYHYSKRIDLGNSNDYLLEFINKEDQLTYVYWTTEAEHSFLWPNSMPVKGMETSMLGEKTKEIDTINNNTLWVSNSPMYLKVEK